MEADFSGYATKAGLKCTDGRTITRDAFTHQDKMQVPLVWQHSHNDPSNILGHAVLEAREDGVYCYGFFNKSENGQGAKHLVEHGDISALSIYANQLVEKSKQVLHGAIREVSLVLSGANSGARIDNVRIAHSDDPSDIYELDDEAIIHLDSGSAELEFAHADDDPEEDEDENEPDEDEDDNVILVIEDADDDEDEDEDEDEDVRHSTSDDSDDSDEDTLAEVYESFTEAQKNVVHYMIGAALEQADDKTSAAAQHSALYDQEGTTNMARNVFDQSDAGNQSQGATLSHAQVEAVFSDATKIGSFKESVLAHAAEYGIEDIDFLFPDAKNVTTTPEFLSRRREWVQSVLDTAKHSPFSRIKSMHADITAEEARAKGYVKGNLKKEEVIKLLKRVTSPTTIYKKQKLDRDDIVDITDFDVVVWLKAEMRLMLEEELARAILVGDGREPDDEDKIDEEKLRPIAWDNEMYAHPVTVPTNISAEGIIESVLRARKHYKGTGTPTLYTSDDVLTDMILLKDKTGRRLYNTEQELAAALRVSNIVVVEIMEDHPDLLGVIVSMSDYTIGADKGGQLAMFDDFDIDYNQQKYLIETRISGALTKAKSAVVVKRVSGTTVTPAAPTFNEETNEITVPSITGVSYYDQATDAKLTGKVTITKTTDVEARADVGYNFPHNTDADWTFAFKA